MPGRAAGLAAQPGRLIVDWFGGSNASWSDHGNEPVPNRRDLDVVKFDGPHHWLLAGGMSWGDSPGDTYDELQLLTILGLL